MLLVAQRAECYPLPSSTQCTRAKQLAVSKIPPATHTPPPPLPSTPLPPSLVRGRTTACVRPPPGPAHPPPPPSHMIFPQSTYTECSRRMRAQCVLCLFSPHMLSFACWGRLTKKRGKIERVPPPLKGVVVGVFRLWKHEDSIAATACAFISVGTHSVVAGGAGFLRDQESHAQRTRALSRGVTRPLTGAQHLCRCTLHRTSPPPPTRQRSQVDARVDEQRSYLSCFSGRARAGPLLLSHANGKKSPCDPHTPTAAGRGMSYKISSIVVPVLTL